MTRTEEYPGKTRYQGVEARHYNRKWRGTPSKRRLWTSEVAVIQTILEAVPKGSLFFDAACGTGRHLPLLLPFDVRWVAADISLDMLHQVPVAGSNGVGLVQADLERLPFTTGSFAYVMCFKLFQLLPMPVARLVLEEFARVSSNGIILEVPLEDDVPFRQAARSTNPLSRLILRGQQSAGPIFHKVRWRVRREWRRRTKISPFFEQRHSEGSVPGVRAQAPTRLADISELATSCGLRVAVVQQMRRSRWTVIVLEPFGSHWLLRGENGEGTLSTPRSAPTTLTPPEGTAGKTPSSSG